MPQCLKSHVATKMQFPSTYTNFAYNVHVSGNSLFVFNAIARPTDVHYNHYVSPSVSKISVEYNENNDGNKK